MFENGDGRAYFSESDRTRPIDEPAVPSRADPLLYNAPHDRAAQPRVASANAPAKFSGRSNDPSR